MGESGMSGQFSVEYDVDHKPEGGEIQVVDGYFVHFFAPRDLPHLFKHVYFILDVSGSMSGKQKSGRKYKAQSFSHSLGLPVCLPIYSAVSLSVPVSPSLFPLQGRSVSLPL